MNNNIVYFKNNNVVSYNHETKTFSNFFIGNNNSQTKDQIDDKAMISCDHCKKFIVYSKGEHIIIFNTEINNKKIINTNQLTYDLYFLNEEMFLQIGTKYFNVYNINGELIKNQSMIRCVYYAINEERTIFCGYVQGFFFVFRLPELEIIYYVQNYLKSVHDINIIGNKIYSKIGTNEENNNKWVLLSIDMENKTHKIHNVLKHIQPRHEKLDFHLGGNYIWLSENELVCLIWIDEHSYLVKYDSINKCNEPCIKIPLESKLLAPLRLINGKVVALCDNIVHEI